MNADPPRPAGARKIEPVPKRTRPAGAPGRGAAITLFLIAAAAAALVPYLWNQVREASSAAVEVSFSLSTPWPAAGGIKPHTGAFLVRSDSHPVLAYSDLHGSVRWLQQGTPVFSPLLGLKALDLPFLAIDANDDGNDDLVIASANRQLYMYDGLRGVQLGITDWFAETLQASPPGTVHSPWGFATASHSSGGKLAMYRGVELKVLRREAYYNGRVLGPGSFLDVNGDGTDDYVVGTDEGRVVWINGADGGLSTVDVHGISLKAEPALGGIAFQLRAPVSGTDFSGDGVDEWILLSRQGRLLVFDPFRKELVCQVQIDSPGPSPASRYSGPVVADLDLDGRPEIVVAHTSGRIYAFTIPEEAGGEILELWSSTPGGSLNGEPVLVDLNSDRIPDLVVTNRDGELMVLDGRDGAILFRIGVGAQGPPLVVDADFDGEIELIIPAGSNWAVVSTSASAASAGEWRQWRGQESRGGIFVAPPAHSTRPWPSAIVLILVAVLSAAFGLRFWIR